MIPPSDELRHLWNADSGAATCDTPELLRRLQRAARGFDRSIRFRDLRESAAGVLVTAVFLWLAILDRTPLERAAHLWLAACGVWIVVYLRRYSKVSRMPSPEQTFLAYRQQLLDRYDSQIRLLRSAKYWYILPLWIGLLFSAVALLERTGNVSAFALMVAWVTLVNAAVWWLNEVIGVRYLSNKRRDLSMLTGNEGV